MDTEAAGDMERDTDEVNFHEMFAQSRTIIKFLLFMKATTAEAGIEDMVHITVAAGTEAGAIMVKQFSCQKSKSKFCDKTNQLK